jgi:hypothetical protein
MVVQLATNSARAAADMSSENLVGGTKPVRTRTSNASRRCD